MLIMVKAKTCGVVKALARYEVSLCDPSPRFLPLVLSEISCLGQTQQLLIILRLIC